MKILIVDDDENMLYLLSQVAKSGGYETYTCTSSQAALEAYRREFFPIILCDWMLPMMDGVQLCQELRRQSYGAKSVIVMITGYGPKANVRAILEAGADDYLNKPIDPEALRVRLEVAERHAREIAARAEAEAALRRAENKYHSIVENAVEGIFQTTPEGYYLSANPALARIYGYETSEELMQSVTDIGNRLYVEPQRRQEFIKLMQEYDTVMDFESRVFRKDGSVIWISENVRAVRDPEAHLLYYEGTVENITTRKEAEFALLKRTQELEAACEELRQAQLQLEISCTETERLNTMFQLFVPKQFLHRIQAQQVSYVQPGEFEEERLSIVFGDIRSYTQHAEKMTPQENLEFLNEFFGTITPAIEKNLGFVDKFIGDEIMALFDQEGSADRAIRAAIEIQEAVNDYNVFRQIQGVLPVQFGIGINTGPVMVGVLGTETRLNSTVIGDHVNLASRLESLTKRYEARILISHYTHEQIQPENYLIRQVDSVQVRGKSQTTIIYEVFDADPPSIKQKKWSTRQWLKQGIALYQRRHFNEALEYFQQCLDHFPEDIVPLEYVKRCRYFQKYPPPFDWVGTVKDGDVFIDQTIRRRWQRYDLNTPANLMMRPGQPHWGAIFRDISSAGGRVELGKEIPIGELVTVQAFFQKTNLQEFLGQSPLEAVCRVVWKKPLSSGQRGTWELGLEFVSITPEQEGLLNRALEELARRHRPYVPLRVLQHVSH